MKLVNFRTAASHDSCFGVTDGAKIWELQCSGSNPVREFQSLVSNWREFKERYSDTNNKTAFHDLDSVVLEPPIASPEKVICIGRNYAEHAAEMDSTVGDIPVVFNKFPSALTAHQCPIILPEISAQVDYEAELVVVIGKTGSNIAREAAMDHVFGYTCGNDVSARDWQKGRPGGQWLTGKTFDTFAPIGPVIVTADEITDPANLDIQCRVNKETVQSSNTCHLIFDIPYLISHISKFCTLRPGDLIFTGTPSGVGAGKSPPVFLQDGDVVEVEISEIGVLRNTVQRSAN